MADFDFKVYFLRRYGLINLDELRYSESKSIFPDRFLAFVLILRDMTFTVRLLWRVERQSRMGLIYYGFITARCTLVQSAVLRSHVVCLSVCLSVTLVNCDHIGWNSSKIISTLVSLGRSLFATPTWRVCSKGTSRNFRPNRGGVLKKRLSAYKSSNISETLQDRTKVTIKVE